MAWLEGTVERVLWAAADGGWAVLRVTTAEGSVIVVGPLGSLAEIADEHPFASFEGRFEQHPSHGHRFKADAVLLGSPRTEAGLVLYLSSGGVPGVGPKIATQIVSRFGVDALRVLEHEPERLLEVPGVGAARAEAVVAAWRADASGRALSILLRGLGLSQRIAQRVQERYGDQAYDVVTRQPYRLAEEVRGVGFLTADALARAQGLPDDAPQRVEAAVVHVVRRATEDGHVVVPMDAVREGLGRLGVPVGGLDAAVAEVVGTGRLAETAWGDDAALVPPELDEAEHRVAALLRARLEAPEGEDVEAQVRHAEALEGITLDPSQREAVQLAATSGVCVVTGGPGTGKTTLVRVLLRVARERGEAWLLGSPTGRAAKRLAESTGQPASTLHRLLGFNPELGRFTRTAAEPLEADGLVVDEVSMVDVELMAAVLDALPWERRFRLVLVGDSDQLPSVGPGQVLRDLIDSGVIPVARLREVHRQAARSGILEAAAAIRGGRVPASGERAGFDDLFLLPREDAEQARATVLEIVTRRLPAKGFDPREDVQVLCPTRRGPLGVEAVGEALRDALDQGQPRVQLGRRAFAEGDKVLCTRNRYDLDVFNGDVGRVVRVDPQGLTIRFDQGTVVWDRGDLDQIELAYAMTVHKSQGSEYPAVVLVLHGVHGIMLRRELFYTAATRASRFLCVVGAPRAWALAASRGEARGRMTRLAALLRG